MHNGYYNDAYGQMPGYGPGYGPPGLPPHQGGPRQHSHPQNEQFLPVPIDPQSGGVVNGGYNMQAAQEFPWQGPHMSNSFIGPAQGPPQTPLRAARDPGPPIYNVNPETGLRTSPRRPKPQQSGGHTTAAATPKAKQAGAATAGAANPPSAADKTDTASKKTKKTAATATAKPKAAGGAEVPAPAAKTRFRWTPEPTLKLVSYFVAPEVWKDWRLKQATHFTKISVDVFNGEVKPKQIKNAWGRTFRMYKETRRLQHATGGDGDADAPETEDDDLLGSFSDDDDDDDTDSKKKKKAKKAAVGDDKEDKPEFSKPTLRKFAKTQAFELLDSVAHDDEEVVRSLEFSSATPVDVKKPAKKEATPADAGDSKSDMKAFLETYSEKTKRQAERDENLFALEKERDKRAEQAFKLQMQESEARLAREHAAEKRAAHEALERRWAFYDRLRSSNDPVMQKKAELMGKQLLEETD